MNNEEKQHLVNIGQRIEVLTEQIQECIKTNDPKAAIEAVEHLNECNDMAELRSMCDSEYQIEVNRSKHINIKKHGIGWNTNPTEHESLHERAAIDAETVAMKYAENEEWIDVKAQADDAYLHYKEAKTERAWNSAVHTAELLTEQF